MSHGPCLGSHRPVWLCAIYTCASSMPQPACVPWQMSDFGPKTAFKIVDGIRDKVRGGSSWLGSSVFNAETSALCQFSAEPAWHGPLVMCCKRLQVKTGQIKTGEQMRAELKASIMGLLTSRGGSSELAIEGAKPAVLLVVGVNGGGKTTTIGKLAHKFSSGGAKVVLGAGDTFRAAAAEQLEEWARRSGSEIVRAASDKARPDTVLFQVGSQRQEKRWPGEEGGSAPSPCQRQATGAALLQSRFCLV